jgi:hypothetical protein
MKKSFLSSFALLVLFGLSTCEKDSVTPPEEGSLVDTLTQAQIDLLDGLVTDHDTKLSDLKFEDGTSVLGFLEEHDPDFLADFNTQGRTKALSTDQTIKLLLARMQAVGFYLVTDSLHKYTRSDGIKQKGLAYSFGTYQYQQRQRPGAGSCNKDIEFHGLECAGMIYQMAEQAGVKTKFLNRPDPNMAGSKFLGDTATWNDGFDLSNDFKALRAYYATPDPKLAELKLGDVIAWNGHIGIVLQSNTIKIFQSNGYTKKDGKHTCESNFDANHGPSIKPITPGFFQGFSPTYKVLRFTDAVSLYLTGGSSKKWKTNPTGRTLYCGLPDVNPPIAMDDTFTFNIDGTFTHAGGAITSSEGCSDGGTYSGSWVFSDDRKKVVLNGAPYTIEIISNDHFKGATGGGTLDLIPN